MKPRDKAIKLLNDENYFFDRHGRNHDLYWNQELNQKIPLKRHDFDEDDLGYIKKEIAHNRRKS